MKTTAAVLVETGAPLQIAELDVPALKPGQTLVEIVRSGVCHTQLLEARGHRGEDKYLPHCLGHEASGIVRDVGPGVTKVQEGDEVVLSWIQGTGANVPGTVYSWNGRSVNAGGITTFGTTMVVSENRLTLKPVGLGWDAAALLGCAVATGAGAVLNTASARPGQSLAVFGVGGVGLNAVSAAVAAGCYPVVAVDVLDAKLELAIRMGATHTIDARADDAVSALDELCPAGLDIAIEASGRPLAMQQALAAVKSRGGRAVIIGNAHHGEVVTLDPQQFNQGKRLFGTWGGDSRPDTDFPLYATLLEAGRLNLEPLIGRAYPLDQVNQALDDLESGVTARPIIKPGG